MSPIRYICEFGSSHQGKLDPIKVAIDECAKYGMALKLQLFPKKPPFNSGGNVWLNPKIFDSAVLYAQKQQVELSASVFGEKELKFLLEYPVSFIKLAYSQKHKKKWIEKILSEGKEAIVSCDVLSVDDISDGVTKLLCDPVYPVPYIRDFAEMFPRFAGYSDHTIGLHQTEVAIESGARIIEKHVRLGNPSEVCPDARFAVRIKDFGEFAKKINSIGKIIQCDDVHKVSLRVRRSDLDTE